MSRYRYRRRGRMSGKEGIVAAVAGVVLAAAVHANGAAAPAATTAQTLSRGSTSTGANVTLGQQMAAGSGWGSGPEWTCLDELWTRESGWQMVWNTAGSGAYGIPQSLPASKMASAGADYMTNPATQIKWGLGYIATTYVTPCGAWNHETQDGWY